MQLKYLWEAWARDNQLPPTGRYVTWLNMGGRGSGKTRSGAEWIRKKKDTTPYLHLIGRTAADVRDVMVEGESGLLAISPPWDRPVYQPSKRRLVWSNGAQAITFSADEPESLRGPQCGGMWCDEVGAWAYEDAWDQAMFGLRLGSNPQACATTTPRVTKLVKKLIQSKTTVLTRSTTYDNRDNLASAFFSQVITRFEHTRLGRQELEGLLIEDLEGALWKREAMIEAFRVTHHPDLARVVVAVDPPASSPGGKKDLSEETRAEAGIIVVGRSTDGHGYVLADYSRYGSPNEWGEAAVTAYNVFEADRIIGEVNNGGDMVEYVIQSIAEKENTSVAYKAVRATRGKVIRAEPVSTLYEQGRCHHVGVFPELEDQLCNWEPGQKSPDRLDALVWGFTELMLDGGDIAIASGGISQREAGLPIMHETDDERITQRQRDLAGFLSDIGRMNF